MKKDAKTAAKTSKKGKLKSKVSRIKKMIALDPEHPGSLTPQQITKKDGKKSKKYYSWQSSYRGEKVSYRIPDENVDEIRKLIDAAKRQSKAEKRKDASIFKSYQKAMKELMDDNAKIRKAAGETSVGGSK